MRWYEAAALCLAASIGSSLLTLAAIRHARRHGLIDAPGERRSHAVGTPRGGGIGIVIVALSGLAAMALASPQPAGWWLAAAGLALVAGTGWWDDHAELPAWPRLLAHLAAGGLLGAAAWLWTGDPRIAGIALVVTPVLVNAWNFMDGIDTLAAGQALLCAAAVALLGTSAALPHALLLAGACAGFLPFNGPPARIFLGDVGSGALGYQLALLAVLAMPALPPVTWVLLLLPPLAMLADAACTLLWRAVRGQRWWAPHVQHLYQRWSRRIGHGRVSLAYSGWTAAMIGFMLYAQAGAREMAVAVAATFVVVAGLLWIWRHGAEGRNS